MRSAFLALALSSVTLVACGGAGLGEDFASGEDALTGNVTVGRTVQTQADGLRLRKTPSKESQKNVIGLLPAGTTVKLLESAPVDGFYKVEVMDDGMRERLLVDTGWVWGEHLNGEAEEPAEEEVVLAQAPAEARVDEAPEYGEPKTVYPIPRFVDCRGRTDDKGAAMVNVETPMGGTPALASLELNSDEFPYGSEATIKQVDLQNNFNPGGSPITFKIVRTLPKHVTTQLYVTICTDAPGFAQSALPKDIFGRVDVTVRPLR